MPPQAARSAPTRPCSSPIQCSASRVSRASHGELSQLEVGHEQEGRDHYYRVRDEEFNPGRRAWLASGGDPERYSVSLAAMLIYLNRTGYNGLFRLNAAGEFNVPAGRYERPRIVSVERISAASALLKRASLRRAQFDDALSRVQAGDVVYLDPPYAPLSATANFRAYTAGGFGDQDQRRLRDCMLALARDGVHVLLSNSTAPPIIKLYETRDARRETLN